MKTAIILSSLFLLLSSPAYAGPNYTAAKRDADNLKKIERQLAKRIARLTETEKMRLKAKFKGTDSDSDGVADIIEGALGSNRCDSDSDDDGFDDSSDYREDSPGSDDNMPGGDDDSGNDSPGSGDATPTPGAGPAEFEAKGRISSFNDPSLVIGGVTYTVASGTQFIGNGFGKDDLDPNTCVEVKGLRDGAERILTRIKRDNDC